MDKMQLPPEGGGQDSQPTQELGPVGGQHLAGSGAAAPAGSGLPRASGRALRWMVGLTAAAILAVGGAGAAVALTSSGSASASGASGQAAALNSMLSSASAPAAAGSGQAAVGRRPCLRIAAGLKAAGHPRAAAGVLRACRRRLLRVLRLGGIHGQIAFETKKGPRTVAFERGALQSASATTVVVRAPDGTTWSWHLTASTVIRRSGTRASTSALSAGEKVFVAGPVLGGSRDARLIVIRPAGAGRSGAPAPGAAGPSGAAGTS